MDQRKVVLFMLAALFSAARKATSQDHLPNLDFDDAEAFLKEAKARGISPEDLS